MIISGDIQNEYKWHNQNCTMGIKSDSGGHSYFLKKKIFSSKFTFVKVDDFSNLLFTGQN